MSRARTTIHSAWLALGLLCALPGYAANVCGRSDSPVNPQAAVAPGIGGTGDTALHPGIGGTGDVAGKPGIGGTGIDNGGIGGTGIVGVITGFASICVNGVEVHYDDATPIQDNGQPVKAGTLTVGQMVAVVARGQGDELQAQRIALQHQAVGPVERVDVPRREVRVLGQTVHWSGDTGALAALRPGQWVRVSGLRLSDGSIESTHVQTVAAQAQASLSGPAEHGPDGSIRVAGATINTRALGLMDGLRLWRAALGGQEVRLQGPWDGGQLLATAQEVQPTRNALGAVERVVVEGFVKSASKDALDIGQGRMVWGAQVSERQRAGLSPEREQRVRITGVRGSDDRITVERIELRQSLDKRPGASGRGSDDKGRSGKSEDSGKSDDSRSGNSGKTESGDDSRSGSNTSGSDSSKSGSTSGSSGDSGSSGGSGSSRTSGSSGGSGSSSGSSGSSGGSGSSGSSGGRSGGK